jgi:serine protease Do
MMTRHRAARAFLAQTGTMGTRILRSRRTRALIALLGSAWGCAWADSPASADELRPGVPELDAVQRAFERVIERVSPSVVGIRARRRSAAALSGGRSAGTPDGAGQAVLVHGSGAILSADGQILTNEHVVRDTSSIDVLFSDGIALPAAVLASDARSDLAILKVARADLAPVAFCEWNEVARGQWAIALGNPFGLGDDGKLSVSTGVIANLDRKLPGLGDTDDRLYNDMIQITAPIHPGNSGGPLFNIQGQLIGVVTAMHTRAVLDEGVGFAIPLSPARRSLIQTLRAGRRVEYGYLGLTVAAAGSDAPGARAEHGGVVVQAVDPDGPAAKAGVCVGDRIVRYDSEPVGGPSRLSELVGQTPAGRSSRVEIDRGGQILRLLLVAESRDMNRVNWMRSGAVAWRGMRLADLTHELRRRLHVSNEAHGAVVIDVVEQSPAARADIHVGDIIERIGDADVSSASELLVRVRNVPGAIGVTLHQRGPRTIGP